MDNRLMIGRSRFEACRAKEGKRTDAGAQRPTDREEDDMAPMPDEAPIPAAVLLSNDSPLRRLATAQQRRQQLALDEISISVDMTALGYQQLRVALWMHSKTTDQTTSRLATVHAVTNAWAVIDAGHRLRVLVQHLDGAIEELLENDRPVRGALSRVNADSPDAKRFSVRGLLLGTMAPPAHPWSTRWSGWSRSPSALVTLAAAETMVCVMSSRRSGGSRGAWSLRQGRRFRQP